MANNFRTGIEIGGKDTGAKKTVDDTSNSVRRLKRDTEDGEAAARKYARSFSDVGGILRTGLGIAGAAIGLRAVLGATIDQERASARLRAILLSTRDAIGYTADELGDMASQLQETTTFSDDAITGAQGILAQYDKIGRSVFPRVQQATLDVATAMGGDLASAAEMVGKAMQDPAEGVSGLNRQFRLFDATGEKVIKRLVDLGRSGEAQDLILRALEERIGGVSKRVDDEFVGSLDHLKNQVNDLLEGKGHSLSSLTAGINDLSTLLNEPSVKEGFDTFASGAVLVLKDAVITVTMLTDGVKSLAEWMARLAGAGANSQRDRAMRMADIDEDLLKNKDKHNPFAESKRKELEAERAELEKQFIYWQEFEQKVNAGTKAQGENADSAKRLKEEREKLRRALGILTPAEELQAAAMRDAGDIEDKLAQGHIERTAAIRELTGQVAPAGEVLNEYESYLQKVSDALLGMPLEETARREQALGQAFLSQKLAAANTIPELEALRAVVEDQGPGLWDDLLNPDPAAAEAAWRQILETINQKMHDVGDTATDVGDTIQEDLTKPFEELKNTLVDLSSEWGRSAAQFVNGLERVVDAQQDIADAQDRVSRLERAGKKDTLDYAKAQRALADAQDTETTKKLAGYAALAEGAAGFFGEESDGYRILMGISRAFHIAEMAMTVERIGAKAIEAIAAQGTVPPPYSFIAMGAMAALLAAYGIKVGRGGGGGETPNQVPGQNLGNGQGTVLGDAGAKSESIAHGIDELVNYANRGLSNSQAMLEQLRAINEGINGVGALLLQANYRASGGATPFNLESSRSFLGHGAADVFADILLPGFGGRVDPLQLGKLPGFNLVQGLGHDLVMGIVGGIVGNVKQEQWDTGLLFQAGQSLSDAIAHGVLGSYFATIKETTSHIFGIGRSESFHDETAPLEAQLQGQFDKIIGGLVDTGLTAVDALGGDVEAARERIGALTLGFDKLSLQGLSPEEIQDKLNAVFSALGDRIAEAADPALLRFQQVGEGQLETLLRVASGYEFAQQATNKLGIELANLAAVESSSTDVARDLIRLSVHNAETITTVVNPALANLTNGLFGVTSATSGLGQMVDQFDGSADDLLEFVQTLYDMRAALNRANLDGQALSQTMVDAAGGIDKLQSGIEAYYAAFFTDQERTTRLIADLNAQLAPLGFTLPETRDGFRSLVEAVSDGVIPGGEHALGVLLSLADDAGHVYDALEAQAKQAVDDVQAILSDHQSEFDAAAKAYQDGIRDISNTLKQETSAIAAAREGVANAILAIRRQQPGWNEAGFQNDQITALRGRLGRGSITDQVGVVQQLQAAIVARYNAEQERIQSLQQMQQQAYQEQKAQYDAQMQALKQLRAFADGLKLSDLSPMLAGERLSEAKSQYARALAEAQSAGTPDHLQALQSAAQAALQEQRSYSASDRNYTALFDQIQADLARVSGQTPNAPQLSRVTPATAYGQEQTVGQLEELNKMLQQLQTKAEEKFDLGFVTLGQTFQVNTDGIVAQLKADAAAAALQHKESRQDILNLGNAMAAGLRQAADKITAQIREQMEAQQETAQSQQIAASTQRAA